MVDASFVALVQNAALLLAMALVYDIALESRRIPSAWARGLVVGILVGAIGLVVMMTPFQYVPGIVFDTRSVLLGVAGLFFGAVPAAVAMAMTAALRLSQGGAAAWTGVAVILASGCIGIAWRRLRGRGLDDLSLREAYLLGLVVHVVMLALMFTLPWAVAIDVIRAIGLPVIVIYPVATALLGALMANRLRRERIRDALADSEERLRLAADAADLGLWDLDLRTGRSAVDPGYARMLGYDPAGFEETVSAATERTHPDDREAVAAAYRDYVAGKVPQYRVEFRYRTTSGDWKWILTLGRIVERDDQGAPLRMLGSHLDISSRRGAEEQLRDAAGATARLLEIEVRSRRALLSIVEDQKAAEAVVRENEARYRDLVMHAPVAILVDRDDRLTLVNDAGLRLFGAQRDEELLGQSPDALFHPDDQARIRERIRRLRDSGDVVEPIEARVVRLDGSVVDVEVTASAFEDQGTRAIHLVLGDISERKRAKEALVRNEELLNEVQQVSLIGGWAYDALAKQITWTREVYRIHELPPDYDPNDLANDIDFYVGDDRRRIEEAFARAVAAGEPYDLELQFRTARGNHRWVRTQGQPRMEDGRTIRIVGNIADITERKRAEAEIRQMALLSDTSPSSITVHDFDGRFLYANERTFELHGYSRDEFMALNLRQVDVPADAALMAARMQELRELGGTSFEVQHLHKDGTVLPLAVAVKITTWDGEKAILSAATDITERKQAEDAIRRLNEELEERVAERTAELEAANRDLESFSYSISHDLRAPLRSIGGFAAILGRRYRDALDEKGRHYVDTIVDSSDRMGILIDELLAYSRLGREMLRAEPVPLGPLVTQLRSTFGERIEASGATLEVVELLATPVGDPMLIERILANLVENALTYRRPDVAPHVTLSATRRGRTVTLTVADNGIGIPPAYRERIFEVFARLHGEDAYPGTGIGLSIVRKAARLMGSDVTLESVEGEGTTFSLELPAAGARGASARNGAST
jgi:PAS domain S-box-containing protein